MRLISDVTVAPFGSWRSPIDSDLVATGTIKLVDVLVDGEDIYWIESRPKEGGRFVLVKHVRGGRDQDVTPAPFNARSRVHEYGGGAVLVDRGVVFFSNFADQKLYRQDQNGIPRPISQGSQCRYADAAVDATRNRLICVREDHRRADGIVINSIVAIAFGGIKGEQVLVQGHDFYSNPRISPDGKRLMWLAWNHPNMPWIGTELWVGIISEAGEIEAPVRIAGAADESVFQPEWSPSGTLHFVSDRTGWWNLYREHEEGAAAVLVKNADFGEPQWVFGMATYGFVPGGSIICSYRETGRSRIAIFSERADQLFPLDLPYTEVSNLRVCSDFLVFLGGAPDKPSSIVKVTLDPITIEVLKQCTDVADRPNIRECLSPPTLIKFPSGRGNVYAWYYAPLNCEFAAPPEELPPLIVKSHGGPTAAASSTLDLRTQYWTTRGYAVLDVDYGGSTGYGREYRNRLHQTWGIVDVEDCTNAAKFIVENKKADPARVAISGGSAGGYTTLCALVFGTFFKVGASYYGVCDLESLARDTHKFESRYLEWLVGRYPEEKETYKARSPINFADQLSVPVIFLQGEDDPIVPRNQAEMMVNILRSKGLPLEYLLFKGEQHGFRIAENIRRALDAELYFYSS
ncbi:MAG: S9 family peptidase, partial [Verrucomicrobia bacterium]|nr:S9 family peptidase [Verrucomicrobiota bacterium]